jgi:hypothetical protein
MGLSFAKAGQPAGHRSHATHAIPAGADELEDGVIVLHVKTMGVDPGQKTIGYLAERGMVASALLALTLLRGSKVPKSQT